MKRLTKQRLRLAGIIIVSLLLAVIAWPKESQLLAPLGLAPADGLAVARGLDLQGGAYLVYEADLTQIEANQQAEALDNTVEVLKRRVDPTGTTEAVVQTASGGRIVVQFPGADNIDILIERLGRTAQLIFLEIPPAPETGQSQPVPTGITGSDVDRAQVDITQQTGQITVSLQMQGGESTRQFADVTTRLNQEGGQMVVLLDEQIVFGPAPVSSPITNGQATLTGAFTTEEAQEIASLINAGALPVPVELVAQRTIGPTLGALSIKQSLVAGLIGLLSVMMFLIIYYRGSGLVGVAALAFYTIATLGVYKLSTLTESYTIVLTLAGVAGFLLSIAVAADGTILVLERAREELGTNRSLRQAVRQGYRRAWTSIRDANAATMIGCVILFQFGTPLIRGFAVTLGIGILLSLLVLTNVTRPLLVYVSRTDILSNRPHWFGLGGKDRS